ncbi:MAG: hypothetical protein Q9166_007842 [cf. Caloplaca sp. 2 TL-2023]
MESSTRIPAVPDQTTFVKEWFDWYRGYSIFTNPDGSEEHRALTGESLSEVDIGHLPRTTEELQAGNVERPRAGLHNALLNRQSREDVTTPSIAPTEIDPEDRIFDSSSSSASSPSNSDSEDHPVDTRLAQQRLLLNLQHNIQDIRANVIELTRRIPNYRESSQVSTISNQLNSISRSVATIRHHHPSFRTQNLSDRQAMDNSTRTNNQHHPQTSTHLTDGPASEDIHRLNDEELQQRMLDLQDEVSRIQTVPVPPEPSDEHDAYMANLARIHRQHLHARHEHQHRERVASLRTREELGNQSQSRIRSSQGRSSRGQLSSLFARPASEQAQAPDLLTSNTEPQSQSAHRNQRSSDLSRGLSGSESYNMAAQTRNLPSYLAARRLQRPRGNLGRIEHPNGLPANEGNSMESVEPSHSSIPRTTITPFDPYTSTLSERPYFPRLGHSNDSLSLSGQLSRPGSALPLTDQSEPSIWRRVESGAIRHASARHSSAEVFFPSPRDPEPVLPQGAVATDYFQASYGYHPGSRVTSSYIEATASEPRSPITPLPQLVPADFFPNLPAEQGVRIWHSAAQEIAEERRRQEQENQPQPSLDNDLTRPEPVAEEAKNVFMECKVCFTQISNQAALPCGEQ